ncbi:MAG: MBL fold metallo-hydrolase [Desulfobacteraceae bacterium]|jgi:phosphoribosyl 1,2-cyclic phosphodiesterase
MKITFWGVRGSIPCPGPNTVKYGGNTACIGIELEDIKRRIIIDAGSGIRELGNKMMAEELKKGPLTAEIFLTHTHWDHIMGFPFFVPIFIPGTKLKIYGPVTYEDETLKEALGGQWTYRYFPVRHEELSSDIEYFDLKEGQTDLGEGLKLTTKYLNHPLLCLGYRFEYNGKIFCTAYDTEPFRNVFSTDPNDPSYDASMAAEGELVAKEENERVEKFCRDADLLVYDTQYTQAEYDAGKVGWGHSTFENAIDVATRNGVKRLALFHHDPLRSDAELDRFEEQYGVSSSDTKPEIFLAREGMQVVI